jgi:histone H3/H4
MIVKSNSKKCLKTNIYKLLKQIHPGQGISKSAMQVQYDIVCDILDRIMIEANTLCKLHVKQVITSRQIQVATQLVLPPELGKIATGQGVQAVTRFIHKEGESGTRSIRAGLCFPVGTIHHYMKSKVERKIGKTAPIYLTAVVEYICAEILNLGGKAIGACKRITPKAIGVAIVADDELEQLFSKCIISHSGSGSIRQPSPLLPPSSSFLIHQQQLSDSQTETDEEEPGRKII